MFSSCWVFIELGQLHLLVFVLLLSARLRTSFSWRFLFVLIRDVWEAHHSFIDKPSFQVLEWKGLMNRFLLKWLQIVLARLDIWDTLVEHGSTLSISNCFTIVNWWFDRIDVLVTYRGIKRLFVGFSIGIVVINNDVHIAVSSFTNHFLNLVLEYLAVLFDEHALLHLCKYLSLIGAEGVLTIDQCLLCDVAGKAHCRLSTRLHGLTSHGLALTELQESGEKRALWCLFFDSSERYKIAWNFNQKLDWILRQWGSWWIFKLANCQGLCQCHL